MWFLGDPTPVTPSQVKACQPISLHNGLVKYFNYREQLLEFIYIYSTANCNKYDQINIKNNTWLKYGLRNILKPIHV